jgi:hypothetical protein
MARNETTFTDGHEGKGGRPKGSPNKATLEVRELARGLIEDPEYQTSLRQRLIAGKAPHMESLLWTHLYGKPVERHEVTASATAVGLEGSEGTGAEAAEPLRSGRNFRMMGGEITPEGAERLRTLMGRVIARMNKEGAEAKAAGELPSAPPPPESA